ncbi:hypothetical protein FRC00_008847 [Tulasnella sp. 408]|nr:hypothetical protein FRC00_008847 [Tulasnella sp. 408]
MPLTRLSLPKILDPGTIPEYFESRPIPRHEGWDRDIACEIRAVLQAQRNLENLFFTWLRYSDQLLSALQATLSPSDIANLKGLEAEPRSAIPFIGIAPKLESLTLLPTVWTGWSDELFLKLKTSSADSQYTLKRLAVHLSYDDQWIWANLEKVLALFPNTETLRLAVRADMQPEDFFEKIASYSHVLPSLRNIEVQYTSLFPEFLSEVGVKSVTALKARYPHLEIIVTPTNQMWLFQRSQKASSNYPPTPFGPVGLRWSESWLKDLPAQNEVSAAI